MMSGMETDITAPARQKKTELLPREEHHKAHTVELTLKTTCASIQSALEQKWCGLSYSCYATRTASIDSILILFLLWSQPQNISKVP